MPFGNLSLIITQKKIRNSKKWRNFSERLKNSFKMIFNSKNVLVDKIDIKLHNEVIRRLRDYVTKY